MITIIRGIPQTKLALARIEAELRAASGPAARAGGEVLARAMVARAPRDTGRLASSIRVDSSGDTARVGADVPYDRFVQKGTRFMAAQAYGVEAGNETTGGIVAAIASVLKSVIH